MTTTTSPSDDRSALGRRAAPEKTSEGTHLLTSALDRYVRQVAGVLGVPVEGVSFEVTDTATAYIALGDRAAAFPGRDVMLVWSATQGWAVSIETEPGEPLIALGRLSGDVVQAPERVVSFVAESLARCEAQPSPVVRPPSMGWSDLAECMDHYTS
ncbi:hypothetical protein SAMN05216553_101698 [Lentzea fradiae]|uniref:DUF6292 domain-containing protein n=1 Tax=Lentzea fradiae TaxID=200378 RepID=A0A1G7L6K6_9PSEU|nr:DUF6292 family protein [Lentzea fradiae]SDF45065.1 hypothetical protein SAMN05216553_101698 [Lentzea fradiae]